LSIQSFVITGFLSWVLACAALLGREGTAFAQAGVGLDETRREGWHVRVCEGTAARSLRFFVQGVGTGIRPRLFARWENGAPRTLVFPAAWRWDSTRQIRFKVANDDDGREVRLCLSYGGTDQKWIIFEGSEASWIGSATDSFDRCPTSGCGSATLPE